MLLYRYYVAGGGCMKIIDSLKARFAALRQKMAWSKDSAAKEESKFGTFRYICQWVYKLRSLFMAIPVAFAAIVMAIYNASKLPEKVAVYFPAFSDGETIIKLTELSRGAAVMIPLLITAGCLLLMFCSRRHTYPWLISIFSLVLPLFFLFVGLFPV